ELERKNEREHRSESTHARHLLPLDESIDEDRGGAREAGSGDDAIRRLETIYTQTERERDEQEGHHAAADVLKAQPEQHRVVDVEVRAVGDHERGTPDEER